LARGSANQPAVNCRTVARSTAEHTGSVRKACTAPDRHRQAGLGATDDPAGCRIGDEGAQLRQLVGRQARVVVHDDEPVAQHVPERLHRRLLAGFEEVLHRVSVPGRVAVGPLLHPAGAGRRLRCIRAAWRVCKERRRGAENHDDHTEGKQDGRKVLEVATVTFANGGDNIGVYVPVSATAGLGGMSAYVVVSLILVGVWVRRRPILRHPPGHRQGPDVERSCQV
jgi:hypothetical protein